MNLMLEPLGLQHFSNDYLNWLGDPEINRFTSRGAFPLMREECEHYLKTCQSQERMVFAIYAGKHHIGNISLQQIDLLNRSAELAILIGDKNARGKGHGLDAAQLICAHGFSELGLNRIYCGTHQDNIGMQKLAEKLGMREEGRSRAAMFKNGVFADVIHYGMLREEFKEA